MSHPFGDLLRQFWARKAILVRMGQGKKDPTGPSGRARVVRIINVLCDAAARVFHHDHRTVDCWLERDGNRAAHIDDSSFSICTVPSF